MNIILFSSLYPNAENPQHGIFVENRLRQLILDENVTVTVIAPVPWFPFRSKLFGQYGSYARVDREELRFGIRVLHPRYLVLPKIGMSISPLTLKQVGLKAIQCLIRKGEKFDLIDAHYFYPDGVAATRIGKSLGLPCVVTARGSDINVLPNFTKPRAAIVQASKDADHMITVSTALKDAMIKLGVNPAKITVLRNGVDLDFFTPHDQTIIRQSFGLKGQKVVAFVGNLVALKGVDLIMKATAKLEGVHLLIAGDGPEKPALIELAKELKLDGRVKFLGRLSAGEIVKLYNASDVLVLASAREGWPNVLLESMACGTPVVATDVGGVKEIITNDVAGLIVKERSSEAIAVALKQILDKSIDRPAIRKYAEAYSWPETSEGQKKIFESLIKQP